MCLLWGPKYRSVTSPLHTFKKCKFCSLLAEKAISSEKEKFSDVYS
jgi:hypothetical protein